MRKIFLAALSVAIVSMSLADVRAQIFVNYMAPPATLAAQVDEAEVVVRGVVEGHRATVSSLDFLSKRPNTTPYTEYQVRVTEVIKGTISVGDTIGVERIGNTTTSLEQGFRPFVAKEDLVLVLKWSPPFNAYRLLYGPESAFTVTNAKIESFGTSKVAKAQQDRPIDDFVQTLHRPDR